MEKTFQIREVFIPTRDGMMVREGEDLSKINRVLMQIQQTTTKPQVREQTPLTGGSNVTTQK